MKKEFITSKGKVVIEREILFIKTIKLHLSESLFYKYLLAFAPPIIFATVFWEEDGPSKYMHLIIWGFFTIKNLPHAWDILVRYSYAYRLPLKSIASYEIKPDDNGLETHVRLKLKSGRIRVITFRNLENQYEGFLEVLSHHIAHPQIA